MPRKVRFKLAWQTYRVGDVITPPALFRDWLMGRGFVEEVEPEDSEKDIPEVASCTSVESALCSTETAIKTPAKKRRGRPKKKTK